MIEQSLRAGGSHIDVLMAGNWNEMEMVKEVREATFLTEDNVSYSDVFDRNDFVATHFVVRVDGCPAGAIRVRWFGNSRAVFEKVCIKDHYRRGLTVFMPLARTAMEHAGRKGFTIGGGRARANTYKLWCKFFGARVVGSPIHTHRGILTPVEFPLPAISVVGTGVIDDPQIEAIICGQEGNLDLSNSLADVA